MHSPPNSKHEGPHPKRYQLSGFNIHALNKPMLFSETTNRLIIYLSTGNNSPQSQHFKPLCQDKVPLPQACPQLLSGGAVYHFQLRFLRRNGLMEEATSCASVRLRCYEFDQTFKNRTCCGASPRRVQNHIFLHLSQKFAPFATVRH